MDRRVIVGLVGLALLGVAESGQAQNAPSRDPSGGTPVGMAPIPSINDSINDTTLRPPGVAMAPATVPTSPPSVLPDGILPRTPIPSKPVTMTPLDPISRSISRGHGLTFLSTLMGKAADRPDATILRTPPRVDPSAKLYQRPLPSIWGNVSLGGPPGSGRPAPYADRKPEATRPQADPSVQPTARPAPYAEDRPRSPRPQAPTSTPPSYRPAEAIPATSDPVPLPTGPEPLPPSPSPEPVAPAPAPVLPEPAGPASPLPLPPADLPSPPPLEPIPTSLPVLEPPSNQPPLLPMPEPEKAPAVSTANPPVDPNLSRTSFDEVALRTPPVIKPRDLPYATIRAAAVGDEIITINELATAVNEQLRQMTAGRQEAISEAEMRQLKNQVASAVLSGMIDQALVIQEARRKMKSNSKAKEAFDEYIDKEWTSQELPPLLRNTASSNIHELKIKLTAQGKSYQSMKEAFHKKMMFHEFLRAEIRNKVNADMIDMRHYYNDHLDLFEQPARMTWREIEIKVGSYPSRAAARKQADEVLARLLHDEDFGTIARSVSNGPTASKGGLYVDMQPGSYGIPVVNDELNRIPTGQVSPILEAPDAFHIIRVESRRDKGPLQFDEVQEKIRGMVLEQNYRKAVDEYLTKLRSRTLIRTMFDRTESDPELARRSAKQD